MNNKNKILFINILLIIILVIVKFVFIDIYTDYYRIVLSFIFPIITIITYILLGLPKERKNATSNITSIIIIFILSFILLSSLSGLFIGFLRNSYSLELKNIFINIYYLIILNISIESIRYMIARKCNNQSIVPLIFTTIIISLIEISIYYGKTSNMNNESIFILITNIILPLVSRNILCSYLAYHFGYIQNIILMIFCSIYPYILPIYPNYNNYISSLIGILLPYIIYLTIRKDINNYEQLRENNNKKYWYINIPIIILTLFIISLVFGIGKYQMISIASGSMEPVYYRGDAIIYEKTNNIKVGDIIVFEYDNKIITHRVYNINNNKIETKGDNNESIDPNTITTNDILGIVKYKIKYLGYLSIWFQELFTR